MSPSSAFLAIQTKDLLSVRWRKVLGTFSFMLIRVCNAAAFWS